MSCDMSPFSSPTKKEWSSVYVLDDWWQDVSSSHEWRNQSMAIKNKMIENYTTSNLLFIKAQIWNSQLVSKFQEPKIPDCILLKYLYVHPSQLALSKWHPCPTGVHSVQFVYQGQFSFKEEVWKSIYKTLHICSTYVLDRNSHDGVHAKTTKESGKRPSG